MTILFTVCKTQSQSYLKHQSDAVRALAELAAKAFVKARSRDVSRKKQLSKTGQVISDEEQTAPIGTSGYLRKEDRKA